MNFDLEQTNLPEKALTTVKNLPFPHLASGKVREIFDLGEYFLMVATDRISAFDVILPTGIPGKGVLLTQISLHWFGQLGGIVPNHLVPNHSEVLNEYLKDYPELIPRSMIVRKLKPLSIEAIVRGYLAGHGWLDYQETGKLFGHALPEGLRQFDELPTPLFTPTTKAKEGHDRPLTEAECIEEVGEDLYNKVKQISLAIYNLGAEKAKEADLVLVDTKFEFGLDSDGSVVLIDEVLTPDSSRYWPIKGSTVENVPFDKQYLRDYLNTLDWNKEAPGPELPPEVVEKTQERYFEVFKKLVASASGK